MDSHIYLHEGIYICKYIHPSIHPSIHACIHACMHTSIHPYIHAYIHTSMYIYIHICIHMCLFCVFSGWFITGLQIWCPHWQKNSRSAAQILFLKFFPRYLVVRFPWNPMISMKSAGFDARPLEVVGHACVQRPTIMGVLWNGVHPKNRDIWWLLNILC